MLKPVGAIVLWTVLIWTNRLWNILKPQENSEISLFSVFVAVGFIFGAIILALTTYLWSQAIINGKLLNLVTYTFAILSSFRWVTKTFEVLNAEHSGAFKAIHAVLAVITCALCVWVLIKSTKYYLSEKNLHKSTQNEIIL